MKRDHIYKKVAVTPKKTVIHFKLFENDPFERIAVHDTALPAEAAAHLQAFVEIIIKEGEDKIKADDRQERIDFSDDEIEDDFPEEDPDVEEVEDAEESIITEDDGMEDEESPEEEPVDFTNEPLPVIENTEMPDYRAMTKEHLIWYVENSEKDVLIEDVKFNFSKNLSPDASLEVIREQVIELAAKELKWK
jgi:hypothetical protein